MTNSVFTVAFYGSTAFQNHRKTYAFGKVYPLISSAGSIPPCQIVLPTINTFNIVASLYDFSDTLIANNVQVTWSGVDKVLGSDFSYIVFKPDNIIYAGLVGAYYLKLTISSNSYNSVLYSEVFTAVANTSQLLKIKYYNQTDLEYPGGKMLYAGINFYNVIYLQAQLCKPEYPFEEDAIKRDGYTFVEKQISFKKYKFAFLASEYLLDAMRLIRMHSSIEITNVDSTVYNVEHFLITPKWEEQGDIASVEAEFECDSVVKAIGRIS